MTSINTHQQLPVGDPKLGLPPEPSQAARIEESLEQAVKYHKLSQSALTSIFAASPDIALILNPGMGMAADSHQQSEVVIVGIDVDDSSSIEKAGNTQAVCDFHNILVEELGKTKERERIIHFSRMLKDPSPFNAFVSNPNAVLLDATNYSSYGTTPLYTSSLEFLTAMLAKAIEFWGLAIPVRTISFILSDGANVDNNNDPSAVAALAVDMQSKEDPQNIVIFCGVSDGRTDFHAVAAGMGINKVLTSANTPSDIRRMAVMASQSAKVASQSAANFAALQGSNNLANFLSNNP